MKRELEPTQSQKEQYERELKEKEMLIEKLKKELEVQKKKEEEDERLIKEAQLLKEKEEQLRKEKEEKEKELEEKSKYQYDSSNDKIKSSLETLSTTINKKKINVSSFEEVRKHKLEIIYDTKITRKTRYETITQSTTQIFEELSTIIESSTKPNKKTLQSLDSSLAVDNLKQKLERKKTKLASKRAYLNETSTLPQKEIKVLKQPKSMQKLFLTLFVYLILFIIMFFTVNHFRNI